MRQYERKEGNSSLVNTDSRCNNLPGNAYNKDQICDIKLANVAQPEQGNSKRGATETTKK